MNDMTFESYCNVKNLMADLESNMEKLFGNDSEILTEARLCVSRLEEKHPEFVEKYKAFAELEIVAFNELKTKFVKLMFEFSDKYSAKGENCLYPKAGQILVNVLCQCLAEAEYQIKGHAPFTDKQLDHICYQIGDWYLMMKPLLEGAHNLGHMKEKLKMMICGDE